MARTTTITLIVVVLSLGIVGIALLKPWIKSGGTGSQSSVDVTHPDESETPEEILEVELTADGLDLIRLRMWESLRAYLSFVLGMGLFIFAIWNNLESSPEGACEGT